MPYPTEDPTQKHDLVVPREFPLTSTTSPGAPSSTKSLTHSPLHVTDTKLLLQKIKQPIASNQRSVCFLCSYPDAPTPPLSRALYIVAVCSTNLLLPLTQTTMTCKCTLAVRRGDGGHVLDEKHATNSPRFVALLKQLHDEHLVAILGLDKHNRFGILQSEGTGDSQDKLSYCATCYVGKFKHLQEYCDQQSITTNNDDDWQPTTPPMEDTNDWQPTTPPMKDTNDWQPTTPPMEESTAIDTNDDNNMWQPPTSAHDEDDSNMWQPPTTEEDEQTGFDAWQPTQQNQQQQQQQQVHNNQQNESSSFHQNSGAAAADAFYSGLTRSLETRSESRLFHMRAFNGWVKATQIQELNPKSGGGSGSLRLLDLACGKGGDLGKWVLHPRGIRNYVGVDVARGSLRDAAIRARKMKQKLPKATFTVADLGADVPGRLRTKTSQQMQKLLSWSLQDEAGYGSTSEEPQFKLVRGGGISQNDKFDVVSIQFAIHYMFSSRQRARRFFQTVSELLEVGGNLIATTIDARIVLEKVMGLGLDLHSYDETKDDGALVQVGGGVCRIQFSPEKTKQIFDAVGKCNGKFDGENLFGLEYNFTLVEGSDHGAGVGEAVDLPEWLNPIPVLTSLAAEAGLELESTENFHEFFANRKDPSKAAAAHRSLYNMKVLDRNGSIPPDNWAVSRLYCALKFRKVQESKMELDEADEQEEEEEVAPPPAKVAKIEHSLADQKLLPMAMMKAKKVAGHRWNELDADEKKELIQLELQNLTW